MNDYFITGFAYNVCGIEKKKKKGKYHKKLNMFIHKIALS